MKLTILAKTVAAAALAAGLVSTHALAKTCELTIESNDAMQFNKKELEIAADCKEVKLTLKHVGKLPKAAMGHNLIITTAKDKKDVLDAGIKAGAAADYEPKGDKRIIAATKMLGGGESDTITFKTNVFKKGEEYNFFCSFPGHGALMTGKVVFKGAAAQG